MLFVNDIIFEGGSGSRLQEKAAVSEVTPFVTEESAALLNGVSIAAPRRSGHVGYGQSFNRETSVKRHATDENVPVLLRPVWRRALSE